MVQKITPVKYIEHNRIHSKTTPYQFPDHITAAFFHKTNYPPSSRPQYQWLPEKWSTLALGLVQTIAVGVTDDVSSTSPLFHLSSTSCNPSNT